MEPTQPQQPLTSPTLPQVPIPSVKIADKLKNLTDNLKVKFNSAPKNTKILVIVIGSLFAIIFLLMILVILFGGKKQVATPLPSPTPISVTPIPNVILGASRYATDSGVLKIESDLNGFQKQLDSEDVKQTDLIVPNLDWNVNFNQ